MRKNLAKEIERVMDNFLATATDDEFWAALEDSGWDEFSKKVVIQAANPDNIEFTMSLTMTLGDWKQLRSQLPTNLYPSFVLYGEIGKAIVKAHQSIEESIEYERKD
jgi:hypothetical protein